MLKATRLAPTLTTIQNLYPTPISIIRHSKTQQTYPSHHTSKAKRTPLLLSSPMISLPGLHATSPHAPHNPSSATPQQQLNCHILQAKQNKRQLSNPPTFPLPNPPSSSTHTTLTAPPTQHHKDPDTSPDKTSPSSTLPPSTS